MPSPTQGGQTEIETAPATRTTEPALTEFTSPPPTEQAPPPKPAPLTGEIPQDLLDAVFEDLLGRIDTSREAVVVDRAGAVVWRDGSLGCPQPGMMYTQALVPGYQIVLRVGEQTYDYHANDRGYFVLCEGGLAEEPLPPSEGGVVDR